MSLDLIDEGKAGRAGQSKAHFEKLTPLERRNIVAQDTYRIRQVLLRSKGYQPYMSPVAGDDDKSSFRHLNSMERHIADEGTIDLFSLIVNAMNEATKAARGEAAAIPAYAQTSIEPGELMSVSRSAIVTMIARAELDQHDAYAKLQDADYKKALGNGANRWRSILTTAKATGLLDALIYYGAINELPDIAGAHHQIELSPLGIRIANFLLGRANNPDPDLPADED